MALKNFRKIMSKNPATGEIYREFDFIGNQELLAKIDKAHEAFLHQKTLDNNQRVEKIERLAGLLERNATKYGKLITMEMGKPINLSVAEVKKCASHCRHYAENINKYLSPDRVKTDAKKSMVNYEPLGVIYQIVPFNFPIWLTIKGGLPSILLGNTIIHRNSDTTPMCGIAMEELFNEAGYESGEFQNVFTSPDQLDLIMSNKKVKGVSFTGSTQTGAIIASTAGKYIKKAVMELGGSDPFIVLPDADLEVATNLAVNGRLSNSGQVCIASKRFIVDERIYEPFKEKLVEKCEAYRIGSPEDPNTQMGPMARPDLLENIEKQIKEAIKAGGKLIYGGERINEGPLAKGNYIKPAIIEVEEGNPILIQETFGPVFALVKAKGEKDSIRIANETEYGLGAVIVTRDVDKGEKLAKEIETGTVFINENTRTDSRLPSGGVKNSGFGRENGDYGVKEFANVKTVWIK